MSFVTMDKDEWKRRARRVLLTGDPNSGKTRSLETWPGPLSIISYPQEKGISSIPSVTKDGKPTVPRVWAEEEEVKDWAKVVKEVKEESAALLKENPSTFAGDGLHKLYSAFLHEATFGASAAGRDFEPRLYSTATTRFMQYLDLVMRSKVENIVFTCWSALEKDDPDERGSAPSRHIFPDLPGQAAKKVMGEFSLVLYANKTPDGKYIWLTQPQGKVWGAAAKMPAEVSARIPATLPQNWANLEQILFGGSK